MEVPEKPKQKRKGKLDERMQTEICAVVGVGASLRAAARLVGCSATAISLLAKRDEEFRERLFRATLQRELVPLQNIKAAGQKSWRAAAWLLQRLNPGEYVAAKPDAITHRQLDTFMQRFVEIICRNLSEKKRLAIEVEVAAMLQDLHEKQQVENDWRRVPRGRA